MEETVFSSEDLLPPQPIRRIAAINTFKPTVSLKNTSLAIWENCAIFASLSYETSIRGDLESPLCLSKMDVKAKIAELAKESLLSSAQYVVNVLASAKNLSKITVVVDSDDSITVDDCTAISNRLSQKLDEANVGSSRYVLEVTTPGLDQPLALIRQYHKNIGRQMKVQLKDHTMVQGKLISSTDNEIVIREESGKGKHKTEREVMIPYENIERAFVMVSFK